MNRIEIIQDRDFRHMKLLKKSYKPPIAVAKKRKFLLISKMLNQKSRLVQIKINRRLKHKKVISIVIKDYDDEDDYNYGMS